MAEKKIPNRQCVGCRESKPKKSLIRIVKMEGDIVAVDATGKKNGRGVYICPNPECLNKAMKSKGIERSLKVPAPENIYEDFEKEMKAFEAR